MKNSEKTEIKTRSTIFFPFINTSVQQDLILAILLIPVWWILGVRFFIFHLIALIILVKLFIIKSKDSSKISIPKEVYFLLLFIGISILSLAVNIKGIPLTRVLASLYNLSFWIIGFFIILVIYNSTKKNHIPLILKAFYVFGGMSGGYVFITICLWMTGKKYLVIESLFLRIFPFLKSTLDKAPLLANSLFLKVISTGYIFNSPLPRTKGFNIYATALGATMIVLIAMTVAYSRIKKSPKGLVVILLLEFVALFFTLSRMAIFGLFFGFAIVFTLINIKEPKYIKIFVSALIILVLFFVLVPPNRVISIVSAFRQGSGELREGLYKETISQAMQKPIIGHGFKPRVKELPIPIGSHSMYLGAIYRTGILGLLVFLMFFTSVFLKWWKQKHVLKKDKILGPLWYYSGVSFLGLLMLMFVEDLDAPPSGCIFQFYYSWLNNFVEEPGRFRDKEMKLCLVSSSGGHLFQLFILKKWWEKHERFWVTFEKEDALSLLENEKSYWSYFPTNRNIKNLIRNTFLALKILRKEKPDIIVSTGAGVAVPFFYVGKLLGAKLIFIEVYDRIDSSTLTGKLVYPITDVFLLQWQEQKKFYSKGRVLGQLL